MSAKYFHKIGEWEQKCCMEKGAFKYFIYIMDSVVIRREYE